MNEMRALIKPQFNSNWKSEIYERPKIYWPVWNDRNSWIQAESYKAFSMVKIAILPRYGWSDWLSVVRWLQLVDLMSGIQGSPVGNTKNGVFRNNGKLDITDVTQRLMELM